MKYEDSFKGTVDDSLSDASTSLEAVKSKAKEIVIPSDFIYAKELETLLSDISKLKLESISTEIHTAEDELEESEYLAQLAAGGLGMDVKKSGLFERFSVGGFLTNLSDSAQEIIPVMKMKNDLNKYTDGQEFLSEEEKNAVKEQIQLINTATIKNSNTDIETFKKNMKHSIDMVNMYIYDQNDDISRLDYPIDWEYENQIGIANIKEYLNDVIHANTHVKEDGYLYTYKDGKEERVTSEDLLNAVREAYEEIHNNSCCRDDEIFSKDQYVPVEGTYCYGNSGTPKAGQLQNSRTNGNNDRVETEYENSVNYVHYSACNRLISMATNMMGLYDDQELGGDNVCSEEYLLGHGFEMAEDFSDIRPGDIIVIGGENSATHYFMINEYDEDTGLCTKYDMGSYPRFLNVQPNDEVPIIEDHWLKEDPTKEVIGIYRIKE